VSPAKKRLSWSRCHLGCWFSWAKETITRWGPDPPMGRGTFEGDMYQLIVMHLCMSAFCIVCLLLLSYVPASTHCGPMHSPPEGWQDDGDAACYQITLHKSRFICLFICRVV